MNASSEATPDDAPPQTGRPSFWRRLGDWFKPPSHPPPEGITQSWDDLRTALGTPEHDVVEELLAEAKAAYQEVTERADSAERRATTIQGAVAIAASLALAGGSLLLDASGTPSHPWEIAISVGFALTVVLFGVAAWRAFLVTWPRFMWSSPAVTDIPRHVQEPDADAIKLKRTCDLLIAYGHNESVASLKVSLLRQAVHWLMSALVALSVVAVLVAAYAIDGSPTRPAPTTGECVSARHQYWRSCASQKQVHIPQRDRRRHHGGDD
jgi:hypothetical protein